MRKVCSRSNRANGYELRPQHVQVIEEAAGPAVRKDERRTASGCGALVYEVDAVPGELVELALSMHKQSPIGPERMPRRTIYASRPSETNGQERYTYGKLDTSLKPQLHSDPLGPRSVPAQGDTKSRLTTKFGYLLLNQDTKPIFNVTTLKSIRYVEMPGGGGVSRRRASIRYGSTAKLNPVLSAFTGSHSPNSFSCRTYKNTGGSTPPSAPNSVPNSRDTDQGPRITSP